MELVRFYRWENSLQELWGYEMSHAYINEHRALVVEDWLDFKISTEKFTDVQELITQRKNKK